MQTKTPRSSVKGETLPLRPVANLKKPLRVVPDLKIPHMRVVIYDRRGFIRLATGHEIAECSNDVKK